MFFIVKIIYRDFGFYNYGKLYILNDLPKWKYSNLNKI